MVTFGIFYAIKLYRVFSYFQAHQHVEINQRFVMMRNAS